VNKLVKTANRQFAYDKLVIALGAECFVPPLKGRELDGVFTIRTIADTAKIYAALPNVKSAVVIGGGVLGLEAAWELLKLNLEVTVIETSPYLLNKQLDAESSERLRAIAESKGAHVITGLGVAEITGPGRVAAVMLGDGTGVEAQMVIISTGVRANTELAKGAGCEIGRAVIVDEQMRTSVSGIFSAGDCAEFEGVNMALWSEASEQGRIAGASAVGDSEEKYVPPSAAVTFNGFDTSLFAIGDAGKNAAHSYKTVTVDEKGSGRYKKLFYLNGRLQGAISLGSGVNVAELTNAVETQAKFSDVAL
jgi:NAD(P)H-nitrite reductase large subunit